MMTAEAADKCMDRTEIVALLPKPDTDSIEGED